MSFRCIVQGCDTIRCDNFRFPVEQSEKNSAWISSLENHQEVPEDYIKSCVCPKHFADTDLLKSDGNIVQLTDDAVPSQFPSHIVNDFGAKRFHLKDEPMDIEDLPHNMLTNDTDNDETSSDFDIAYSLSKFRRNYEFKHENDSDEDMQFSLANFRSIQTDDDSNSDDEQASDYDVLHLQGCVAEKSDELKNGQVKLQSMMDMISKQKETISKLEAELGVLARIKDCKADVEKSFDTLPTENDRNYHIDFMTFSISLYYFSTNVYAYLRSIIPQLPSKTVICEWMKDRDILKTFPPGIFDPDKFCFD